MDLPGQLTFDFARPTIQPESWYSAQETAKIVGISVRHLCYAPDGPVKRGKIKCTPRRPGAAYRKYRFLGKWIADYLCPPVSAVLPEYGRRETRGRKPKRQYHNLEI